MLIVALVLAVIGLAALVTAVVTSNELIAWVCIVASIVGVLLLVVDAVRERSGRNARPAEEGETEEASQFDEEYPDEPQPERNDEAETTVVEQAEDDTAGEERNR